MARIKTLYKLKQKKLKYQSVISNNQLKAITDSKLESLTESTFSPDSSNVQKIPYLARWNLKL